MQDGGVHTVEIVFLLLLLFVAAFGALACRLRTPYPIILVIAGLLLGFVPGIPTDAIAATSIARRIGLPKRIVDILEGESLINDATALLALEFGIALLVRGHTPTVVSGLLRLAYLAVVGLAVGWLIGAIVNWIEHHIDDAPIEIALSLLTPYAAYLAADSIRASGVLAVVACGLYLSRRSSGFFSPGVRLQTYAVWDSLTFILIRRSFR